MGVEPTPSASQADVPTAYTMLIERKVGESNPIQPRRRGDWLATRFLSQFGYLPYFSGPTGNRTRIPATPGRCLPVGRSAHFQWT